MNPFRKIQYLLIAIVLIYLLWRLVYFSPEKKLIHLQGTTMGPIPYSIKYFDKQNRSFQAEVDSLLIVFNNSLSTYIPQSEISQFNANDTVIFETLFFYPILKMSEEVYKNSQGSFDPTIGPLVNAWGFGPEKNIEIDSAKINSLLAIIGFDKIKYDNTSATKKKGMYLDLSAVAKGYGIDVVTDFLQSRNIHDYMVEIGGEVACKGKNQYDKLWSIGIENPKMNSDNEPLFAIAKLENTALATSGNYKNYIVKDGKIIVHTINPKTGYPIVHNLLSASIFAKNCTLADAYATACMVMGLEASKKMIQQTKNTECLLIYTNEKGSLEVFISDGITSKIELL